ncbi:hypothetical protein [Streptomyces mirabilis]|uniref:hypothetical protein n=1 Tax=Streptomyces mirabilis TaxID=68239 RepID=UPI00352C2264
MVLGLLRRVGEPALGRRARPPGDAHVLVEVTDSHGCLVPEATLKVVFQVDGAGELDGVGNGNPDNVDSFRQPSRSEPARTEVSRSPGPVPEKGVGGTNTGLTDARSEDFLCVVSPLCLRIPAELSVIGNGRIPRRPIAVLTDARDPHARRGVGRTCRGMGDGVGTVGFSRRRSG